MASYTKRGKTWTYIISHYVNGVYDPIRKGGFKTKKEAEVAAREVESQLDKGIKPKLGKVVFSDYFEDWYKTYKVKLAPATKYSYKYTLESIEKHLDGVTLQSMTKRKYQLFINEFGEGKSKETVSKVNRHIRECVLDAIDEGIISINFTRKVTVYYTVEAKKSSEKHLNYTDSQLLLDEVINRLDRGLTYYLILLALSSGLRFGELVGLTRKDFDFKNNVINVDKTWGYTKRMHEGFGPTKNKASVRKVDVSPNVLKYFKDLFDNTPTNIYQLVFYSPTSKYKVISNAGANKTLKGVLTDLGIDVITAHGLRHTFASILLYKRLSLGYVSMALGHENTITTQEDYAHVLDELKDEDTKAAVEIFNEMVV